MKRLDATSAPETHAILAAAIEVQRNFGTGLLESAYGDALELEFSARGISHAREVPVPLFYKGQRIKTTYRADFVCFSNIILELKASRAFGAADLAQMWHYLAATGLGIGLLVNFGRSPLQIRRFAGEAMLPVSPDSVDSVAS